MGFSFYERKIFDQGYQLIGGIDEAGRGPLAGPVTAGIVLIKQNLTKLKDYKIKDSKQLTVRQREEIFEKVKQDKDIQWKVCFVSPQVIDRINIWQATQLAWRRCLKRINRPSFLFLDGRHQLANLEIPQKAVVRGDTKLKTLALASIIAKVSRDRFMEKMALRYPEYGFQLHKGYGTFYHLQKLNRYGPCPIHRMSFRPVFESAKFKDKVYYLVGKIPGGEVRTYRQIAQLAGHPRAYRAVGNLLNKNRNPKIPCHRVIRSDGKIGGYAKGSDKKRKILIQEKAI